MNLVIINLQCRIVGWRAARMLGQAIFFIAAFWVANTAAAAECEGGRCEYFQAQAAAGCASNQMGEEGQDKAARLSADVLRFLEAQKAQVVLLGRAGSPAPTERFLRKVGGSGAWNYTHGGLAFRRHPAGAWTVVQLLNVCGELGGVFTESFEEFFLDNPYEYRAVAAVPSPEMQAALSKIILDDNLALPLHSGGVYSSISHPFSLERQNSNEYILDIFAAALASMEERKINNRREAKNYFTSSAHRSLLQLEMIQAGLIERLALQIGLGPDNATLDDHPPESRAIGEYEFVSVGALVQFLDNLGHLSEVKQFQLADLEQASDTTVVEP